MTTNPIERLAFNHTGMSFVVTVRKRFGTDALYTIGIEQGLLMLSMLPAFAEYIENSRKRYKLKLKRFWTE